MLTFSLDTQVQNLRAHWPGWGGGIAALFLFSLYLSTFLAIVLSVVLGIAWLISGRYRSLPGLIRQHAVIQWSLLLYAVFIIGITYSSATNDDAIPMIKKFRELFFIPVLIPFFYDRKSRALAWFAVVAASLVSLLISYLMAFHVLPTGNVPDPALKSRITHSIVIAFFAYYCLHKFFERNRYAWAYAAMAIIAVHNLFFIVEGRTGQLIVLMLASLFAWQRLAFRGRVLTILTLVAFMGFFLVYSDKAERINEGIANTQALLQEQKETKVSSMGQRFTFWKYSFILIDEKPVLGHGTGSFASEYARIAKGERYLARHPHNEYLFIAVQLGLLGLIPYLAFLLSPFVESRHLPEPEKCLLQGLALSLVIVSVFNTPFYDHTEGHWFAVMIALCLAASSASERVVHD